MNIGDHHLHLRKRMYENLEPYPHPKRLQRGFDLLMYTVGVLAPLALLPQVIHLYLSQNASGLSLISWILLGTINTLWICYATLHREYPILLANIGMGILNFTMAIGILLYR